LYTLINHGFRLKELEIFILSGTYTET